MINIINLKAKTSFNIAMVLSLVKVSYLISGCPSPPGPPKEGRDWGSTLLICDKLMFLSLIRLVST
jgi:hypothetical protein